MRQYSGEHVITLAPAASEGHSKPRAREYLERVRNIAIVASYAAPRGGVISFLISGGVLSSGRPSSRRPYEMHLVLLIRQL
jgi:hypothetical protein